jgi:hypothetical protein
MSPFYGCDTGAQLKSKSFVKKKAAEEAAFYYNLERKKSINRRRGRHRHRGRRRPCRRP